MIRITLLWMFVAGVSLYAWKDWYRALCGLILLMAVIQHPDMPRTLAGIQGLNPWNIALASVMAAWWSNRKVEGLTFDMPRKIRIAFGLYMAVAFIGFCRMIVDAGALQESTGYLIGEHFVNVFKWVVPGILLFDGCRSRERFRFAMFSILAMYALLAIQVIRWVPFEYAMSGDDLASRSHKIIGNEIGYHRVNMSMMLAGASWAVFISRVIVTNWALRAGILAASVMVLYGQALTAGRAGYVTWGVIGVFLCAVRWKRYLLLAPAVALAVAVFAPGVTGRLMMGFGESEEERSSSRIEEAVRANRVQALGSDTDDSEIDLYTVTSGRFFAWPFVIEKIRESPIVGYGKEAMKRTGLTAFLLTEFNEGFPHPHNAYLEILLDSGVVGFLLVGVFYALLLYQAFSLFRDTRSPVFTAAGGVCCALMLALLVAAMGSQTFYPREGSVGMWCVMGLMMRVGIERRAALAAARQTTDEIASQPRRVAAVRPLRGAVRRPTGARLVGNRVSKTLNLDPLLWKSAA